MNTIALESDTAHFLETLLWANGGDSNPHWDNWTIHQFHPEFTQAVDQFISGFREYLATLAERYGELPDAEVNPSVHCAYNDPDAGERSFGGNVYLTLSGHGAGFWDDSDSDYGKAMSEALYAYAGSQYTFEQMDLMKFNGRIHLAYRTAEFRREYLAKMFTPTHS